MVEIGNWCARVAGIHASPTATVALAKIGALYVIEGEVRGNAFPDSATLFRLDYRKPKIISPRPDSGLRVFSGLKSFGAEQKSSKIVL